MFLHSLTNNPWHPDPPLNLPSLTTHKTSHWTSSNFGCRNLSRLKSSQPTVLIVYQEATNWRHLHVHHGFPADDTGTGCLAPNHATYPTPTHAPTWITAVFWGLQRLFCPEVGDVKFPTILLISANFQFWLQWNLFWFCEKKRRKEAIVSRDRGAEVVDRGHKHFRCPCGRGFTTSKDSGEGCTNGARASWTRTTKVNCPHGTESWRRKEECTA